MPNTPQNSQLVPMKEKADVVRGLLLKHKDQIAAALPRHMTADRMLRVAMTAVNKTPKLLDCSPASLFAAIVQASQLGLEPDGVLGMAYLIPFRNNRKNTTDVQFMIGYKGLLDLARRSGSLISIEARVVLTKDKFKYAFGLKPELVHVPSDKPDAGPVVAAYAIARLREGGTQFEVMRTTEIEKIRSKSRAANEGPWVEYWDEMAKKTVLRRLCKLLPVSIELQRAVALDELAEAGLPQDLDPVIADDEAATPASGLDALVAANSETTTKATDAPQEPAL